MKDRLRVFTIVSRILLIATLGTLSSALIAEQPDEERQVDRERRSNNSERIGILEEEIEKMKLNRATKQYKSYGGLGPAASGVYYVDEGLSWGGYGEIKFRDYRSDVKTDEADVHRFILYAGYKFNDWIVLNTEIEYEHAGFVTESVNQCSDSTCSSSSSKSFNEAEVFVEFAYLDFKFANWFQVAAGLQLVPMGITNYMHEPTTFYTVERPQTESSIIPSTWRDIGILIHGEPLEGLLRYKLGVLTGMKGSGFSGSSWIRGGRTKGSEVKSEDLAYVASLDVFPLAGLMLGGSYYYGGSGQDEIQQVNFMSRLDFDNLGITDPILKSDAQREFRAGRQERARFHLAEGHIRYQTGPFHLQGLFARGWMDEETARAINANTGNNVGVVVEGGYVELGYDILSFFDTSHRLMAIVRNEYVNTQKETVRRYQGGLEDIQDSVASNSGGLFEVASNQNVGVISNSKAGAELYGVQGTADRTLDRRIITYGLAYFPHPNVAIKADYESWDSKSNLTADIEEKNGSNNKIDRFNLAVTFIF